MFLSERFELDVKNEGNPFVARLAPAMRIGSRLTQKRVHPAALLLGLFATAFTATIVLRLATQLVALAGRSAF